MIFRIFDPPPSPSGYLRSLWTVPSSKLASENYCPLNFMASTCESEKTDHIYPWLKLANIWHSTFVCQIIFSWSPFWQFLHKAHWHLRHFSKSGFDIIVVHSRQTGIKPWLVYLLGSYLSAFYKSFTLNDWFNILDTSANK